MTTQVLRGKIEPLALIDVLAYLGRNKASGALRVSRDNVEKSIIISEGTIVFARSNQMQDRLGDTLLAQGHISQEAYDEATAITYEKGIRHGRALVEVGAISPKQLWNTVQEQIRNIASSVIPWEHGQFEFFKQPIKKKESITLKWPIMKMIGDVIRGLDNVKLFQSRFTDLTEVLSLDSSGQENLQLEPYEEHILHFIDGKTTIAQICEHSDYGEAETLRVLYLLKSMGWVQVLETSQPDNTEAHPMVANFNRLYAFLHEYLAQQVGDVGKNLLKKYFEEIRSQHPLIFEGVTLTGEGTPHGGQVTRNLNKLDVDASETMIALDDALNEYLNMCILAVTKLMGAEHEAIVVEKIAEIT